MEIWKGIVGYEEKYQVSSLGSVKSLSTWTSGSTNRSIRRTKEKILKPSIHVNGYLFYRLSKKKAVKTFTQHQLVATAFIPNPDNKPCVNHIDGNPTNNNISNLEWVTVRENVSHGTRRLKKNKLYTCVYLPEGCKSFIMHCEINGKRIKIGKFPTAKLAYERYLLELGKAGIENRYALKA